MGNTFKKESTKVTYDHRVQPTGSANPVYPSTTYSGYTYSNPTPAPVSQTYPQTTTSVASKHDGNTVVVHPAPRTAIKDGYSGTEKVRIETEVETADGFRKLDLVIDHEQFVRLFMDPRIELMISDMSYLIGYKMVYVVDAYRKRIPNVIAIVTMKINSNNNAIFQSEGRHAKKDAYEMINLSKRIGTNNHYSRDSQAESLRHTGGDMIAWEHSTKFCAHNVETLALTFCGKFKDVINACRKYDTNMAFAESAYTYEENQDPVVYEVGVTNYSKHERPNVASGGCLDFFHFFLRPEYAMDYGFWQFQYSDKRSDVNKAEIVLGKKFADLRKVAHKELYHGDLDRSRSRVKLIRTDKGYVSSQVMTNAEQDKAANKTVERAVDNIADELKKELRTTSSPVQAPVAPTPLPSIEEKLVSCIFDPVPITTAANVAANVAPTVAANVAPTVTTTTAPLLDVSTIPVWHDTPITTPVVTSEPVNNQPVDLLTPEIVPLPVFAPAITAQPTPIEYPSVTGSINTPVVDQYGSTPYSASVQPDASGLRFRGHGIGPLGQY